MTRRAHRRQAGFIITLEFILFTTIVVIGSFVGLAAVRNGIIRLINARAATAVVVYDSSNPRKLIGKAVDFDEFESPRVLFLTPDPSDVTLALRLLLGVRNTRFSTVTEVFYTGPACSGDPYVAPPGIIPTVLTAGMLTPTSPPEPFRTSILYDIQESGPSGSANRINFAIGAPGDLLYRSDAFIAGVTPTFEPVIASVYRSHFIFDSTNQPPDVAVGDCNFSSPDLDFFPAAAVPPIGAEDCGPCFTFGGPVPLGVTIGPLLPASLVASPDLTMFAKPLAVLATWPPDSTVLTVAVPEEAPLQTVGTPFPDPIPDPVFPDAGPEADPPLPPIP